jgi:hypothetical protein
VFVGVAGKRWTLDDLERDLEAFEREVTPEQDIGARLFCADLARAVGVLTVLARQYDVVLMNPPYGDMADGAREYAKGKRKGTGAYATTHHDYATAFIEQGADLAHPNGMLGALVPRSFMYLSTAADMDREEDGDAPDGGDEPDDATDDEAPAGGAGSAVSPELATDLVSRWLSFYVKKTIEADEDGIVPLLKTYERPLLDRVRETMVADLSSEAARALEEQARPYLEDQTLETWLETGFFPWHVKLYKNRPIFWLITSECFERGATRLTFRAYVHALKVTSDTLPRMASYYFEPVLDAAIAEEARAVEIPAGLPAKERRAAEKTAREWTATVAALKGFRAALEQVIRGPAKKEIVPANAKWLARTIADVRGGQDAGHGYKPDVDHGVRVNITPLAERKLLPRVVLSKLGG